MKDFAWMFQKGKRQHEEFRRSFRGRLNAEIYRADPEHERYVEAALGFVIEILGHGYGVRGVTAASPTVAGWIDSIIRGIPNWDFPPIPNAAVTGALLAGCEDWSDVDCGRIDALVDEACVIASRDASDEFVGPKRPSLTVLGLVSWHPDRGTDGVPGFERLATFVREQAAFRRLATVEPEHAGNELVSFSSHFGGVDVPEEQRPEYERNHRHAWDMGVSLELWDELGLLPGPPPK